ncbi:cryptochrome/photolyase family protein [Arthrobacter sp. Bz4]|uniref:cryptochrome/photolyase family protein n=1 Tax=Arthrobacter sp. Bz4 TaxID=2171979 RepID=UPI000D51D2AC|nr:cryptochrome/photolyase family protein [Arthrobacter sp. Bz4]PVE19671.1 cryptochrome/photolyase family protein [Arthrobacter sp. Bz4]
MHVQLVFPHQLFEEHLEAPSSHRFILVEDDLFFRQYRFHQQKLVLHRASMRLFAQRLKDSGHAVDYLETSATQASQDRLGALLGELGATRCTYYEVVDDWLNQRLATTLGDLGLPAQIETSPGFLLSGEDISGYFRDNGWRMQNFYEWQRRRLGILVEPDGSPIGGRWSFDSENRKKLPKGMTLPDLPVFDRSDEVLSALEWVAQEFPDNPGAAAGFNWPVTHQEAAAALEAFLNDRFTKFGPYEDAISAPDSFLFHSVLSSSLNLGLLSPLEVVDVTLDHAARHDTPLASVEGFIRQVIGWREYMRASYLLRGREMRTINTLGFERRLDDGWWTGETGLEPVDVVIKRVDATSYAHHIERLMVLGNAMALLRMHPDDVYEWFMAMFIDAYDWVMVPNVYAMSQFAAGNMITTKPYVSGSNYLKKMSNFPPGPWQDSWDALYWQFVSDHREMFSRNPRSSMMVSLYDKFDDDKKVRLQNEAARWLQGK